MKQSVSRLTTLSIGAAAATGMALLLAASAGASSLKRTTMNLSSSADPTGSGVPITFTAKVSDAAGKSLLGMVGFSIKDNAGNVVTFGCNGAGDVLGVRGNPATAKCTVAAGALTEAGSPYAVTATFGSGAGFANSSKTLTQIISHVAPQ